MQQRKGVWGVEHRGSLNCQFGVEGVLDDAHHALQPTSVLRPWDSPSKNIRAGYHFLLQGIFLTQGWDVRLLCLLHWQVD